MKYTYKIISQNFDTLSLKRSIERFNEKTAQYGLYGELFSNIQAKNGTLTGPTRFFTVAPGMGVIKISHIDQDDLYNGVFSIEYEIIPGEYCGGSLSHNDLVTLIEKNYFIIAPRFIGSQTDDTMKITNIVTFDVVGNIHGKFSKFSKLIDEPGQKAPILSDKEDFFRYECNWRKS